MEMYKTKDKICNIRKHCKGYHCKNTGYTWSECNSDRKKINQHVQDQKKLKITFCNETIISTVYIIIELNKSK